MKFSLNVIVTAVTENLSKPIETFRFSDHHGDRFQPDETAFPMVPRDTRRSTSRVTSIEVRVSMTVLVPPSSVMISSTIICFTGFKSISTMWTQTIT